MLSDKDFADFMEAFESLKELFKAGGGSEFEMVGD